MGGVVFIALILSAFVFYARRKPKGSLNVAAATGYGGDTPPPTKEDFRHVNNPNENAMRGAFDGEDEPAKLHPSVGLDARERYLEGDRISESMRYSNY